MHSPTVIDRPTEMPAGVQKNRYKMTLSQTQYSTELGGRLPAGAVVLVDEPTAIRWYELNIAEPADPATPTHFEQIRNQKRDEFRRLAQPAEGIFDAMVGRGNSPAAQGDTRPYPMAQPMPTGQRRGRGALAGAEIVNAPSVED